MNSVEHFQNIDVDTMTYGTVSQKWTNVADQPIKSFKLPLPLGSIKPPPVNSSKTTLAELKYLSKLTTQDIHEKAAFLERDSVLKYFIKFAGENGLMYSEPHLTQANADVESLCTKLKLLYNRPRPAQLGFITNITINTVKQSETPSYPCCATMQAEVLAGLLSYNNPKMKETLNSISKKVELSRLYGGLNFPSDNITALQIADIILKNIKYLESEQ